MEKKRYLTLLALLVGISVCIPGCNGENNKQEQVVENVTQETEDEIKKENLSGEEAIQKSTGFSTEYTVEDAKDGYFIVSKLDGSLYGLLDSYGSEILSLEFDDISFPESDEAKAVIVKTEGKMGLYDYEGKEILPVEYENISNYGSNSKYYLVQKDSVQSLMGLEGTLEKVLQGTYDAVLSNAFLALRVSPEIDAYSAQAVYDLEERLLYECKYSKADKTEYDDILSMDNVNGVLKLSSKSPEIYSSLMDDSGEILFTTTDISKSDWAINGLQNDNIFRISGENQKVYNLATGKTEDHGYKNIVRADETTILASTEGGNVDVYNMGGELEESLSLAAEGLRIVDGSSLIIAQYGETYRIYDKGGNPLSDERYLDVESVENYWMLQNLDGEYGLMDNTGNIRVQFGAMGKESYDGKEWKETYVFDDTFCIVTESGEGSNIWLF